MDCAMTTIDEEIAKVRQQLDQLRNTDYVPERKRQAYFNSIADAERKLLDLLRLKGES